MGFCNPGMRHGRETERIVGMLENAGSSGTGASRLEGIPKGGPSTSLEGSVVIGGVNGGAIMDRIRSRQGV